MKSTSLILEFLQEDKDILEAHFKDLTEFVRSDVVLPKLVKAGILTHQVCPNNIANILYKTGLRFNN